MRGWGRAVAALAQWPAGTTASRRCDVFFSFGARRCSASAAPAEERADETPDAGDDINDSDGAAWGDCDGDDGDGVTLPPRPAYYALARRQSGSTSRPTVVPIDGHFFDAVAQELMAHPKLQAVFERQHGKPPAERHQVAVMACTDPETAALFAALRERAGRSASMARGQPSIEEHRVEEYVHGHGGGP